MFFNSYKLKQIARNIIEQDSILKHCQLGNHTCFSGHHKVSVLRGRVLNPQVNKFKQVFSDDHQMSVGWVGTQGPYPGRGGRYTGLMSGGGRYPGPMSGGRYLGPMSVGGRYPGPISGGRGYVPRSHVGGGRYPGLVSEGGGKYPGPMLVGVGTQVPCLVEGVGTQVPFTYLPPCEQTNAGENITFPLLRLQLGR